MSLGHAAFMAVGAYAGGLVTLDPAIKATSLQELPHWLRDWSGGTFTAVLVVIGVTLVVATVTGLPLLRMAGSAFVIASYAVLVVVNVVLNAADTWTRGAQTFYGLSGELGIWTALACVAGSRHRRRGIPRSAPVDRLRGRRDRRLMAISTTSVRPFRGAPSVEATRPEVVSSISRYRGGRHRSEPGPARPLRVGANLQWA